MSDAIVPIKGLGVPDPGGSLRALREGRAEQIREGRNLAAMPAPDSALPPEIEPTPEVSPHGTASSYRVASNEEAWPNREEGRIPSGQPLVWELTPQEEREMRSLRRQDSKPSKQDSDRDSDRD